MLAAREIDDDAMPILALRNDIIHVEGQGRPDANLFQDGRDTFQKQLSLQLDLHMEEQQADQFAEGGSAMILFVWRSSNAMR